MHSTPTQRGRKTTQSLVSVTGSDFQKWAERSTSTKGAYSTLFPLVAISLLYLSILFRSSAPGAAATNTLEDSQLLFPRQVSNSDTANGAPSNQTKCGFKGDSDTYGYGIRIGVYLQWVTNSIAYIFVPEEAARMAGVNNCFQAAMFAGLIYITTKPRPSDQGQLHAVEAFIMLLLGLGFFFVGSLYAKDCLAPDAKGKPTSMGGVLSKVYVNFKAMAVGDLGSLSLGLGFCVYGIWFAFRGMDLIQAEPCSTFVFFFTKVDLYGWYRTFLKAMFIFGTVLCATFAMIRYLAMRRAETAEKKEYQKCHAINMSSGVCLILLMITVERTIKWNFITSVSVIGGTGQVLPIILGAWELFRILRRLMIIALIHLAQQP